jgi:hypothetical protein
MTETSRMRVPRHIITSPPFIALFTKLWKLEQENIKLFDKLEVAQEEIAKQKRVRENADIFYNYLLSKISTFNVEECQPLLSLMLTIEKMRMKDPSNYECIFENNGPMGDTMSYVHDGTPHNIHPWGINDNRSATMRQNAIFNNLHEVNLQWVIEMKNKIINSSGTCTDNVDPMKCCAAACRMCTLIRSYIVPEEGEE